MKANPFFRFQAISLVIATAMLSAACGRAGAAPTPTPLPPPTPTLSAEGESLLAVARAFNEAVNAGDADAVAALFAEDAAVADGGYRLSGREKIREWVETSALANQLHLELIDFRVKDDKILWLNEATDRSSQVAYYVKNEAVVQGGRIKSLAASTVEEP